MNENQLATICMPISKCCTTQHLTGLRITPYPSHHGNCGNSNDGMYLKKHKKKSIQQIHNQNFYLILFLFAGGRSQDNEKVYHWRHKGEFQSICRKILSSRYYLSLLITYIRYYGLSSFQEGDTKLYIFSKEITVFCEKCRIVKSWPQFQKSHYFLPFSGQKLTKSQEEALANLDENAKLTDKIMVKYRRLIGILIPFIFFQVCWWCLAFKHDYFTLFPSRYILSLTMVLGATVAGKYQKCVNKKLP